MKHYLMLKFNGNTFFKFIADLPEGTTAENVSVEIIQDDESEICEKCGDIKIGGACPALLSPCIELSGNAALFHKYTLRK